MGDVVSIERIVRSSNNDNNLTSSSNSSNSSNVHGAGEKFLTIHWDGFRRTEADELYHAVWDSVRGSSTLRAPVTGRLTVVVTEKDASCMDETTVLAQIEDIVDPNDVGRCRTAPDLLWRVVAAAAAHHRWVSQAEYDAFVQSHASGQFADQQ